MSDKYEYPLQLASIKKNDWRFRNLIDKGLNEEKLQIAESGLWKQIEKIANEAEAPPSNNPEYPGSKLLGYGWEWAVYELGSGEEVVKVPAGIFKEVGEREYLENTEIAYDVCKKYLKGFVLDTKFERIDTIGGKLNTISQNKVNGDEISFVDPISLQSELKKHLVNIGEALLVMLKEEQWLPDFHLWRKEEGGKKGWNIWNLFIENNTPIVFDFTAYYDVWRLYPQRTEEEIKVKGKNWKDFISELSN